MPTGGSILSPCYNQCTCKSPIHLKNYNYNNGQLDFRTSSIPVFKPRDQAIVYRIEGVHALISGSSIVKQRSLRCVPNNVSHESSVDDDEDDELCPVECVKEFKTDEEFLKILEKSKRTNALVVVDFYRTSCGSCKYIEQGFSKLCKASGEDDVPVIFLKHNVIDEYDEQSEVAERLRIKTVPLFHFYKDGILQEAFATRDKERVTEAVYKYMSPPAPSPAPAPAPQESTK